MTHPREPSSWPALARLPEEWAKDVTALGGRPFQGMQVFRWIHARGTTNPEEMTDLSKGLRAKLVGGLGPALEVTTVRRSSDGTRKLLLRLHDGASVETVLIPEVAPAKGELPSPVEPLDADAAALDEGPEDDGEECGEARPRRVTQCISTQVGCAMGCVFCASGVAGLTRNMGADEIVAQVLTGRSALEPGEALRGVVLMGMGEPLHNYDATARALRLLVHRDGIALSSRRVTVSTSGLVPEIKRLGEDFQGQIGLAVSLHSADEETRSRLMPINRKYPLAEVILALRSYPLPARRRITIEYTLIAGENDSDEDAKKLAAVLRGIPVKVNLIPMNPVASSGLRAPDFARVLAFQRRLCDVGYSCFIRRRRGDDLDAACGQLALLGGKPKVKGLR